MFIRQRFVKKSYIELHENPTDGLVADTRSRMDVGTVGYLLQIG